MATLRQAKRKVGEDPRGSKHARSDQQLTIPEVLGLIPLYFICLAADF
jgi:hypothetical protein